MLEPWTPDMILSDGASGKTSTSSAQAPTSANPTSNAKPPLSKPLPGVGFGTSTKTAGPGQITSKEVANLAGQTKTIQVKAVTNEN